MYHDQKRSKIQKSEIIAYKVAVLKIKRAG